MVVDHQKHKMKKLNECRLTAQEVRNHIATAKEEQRSLAASHHPYYGIKDSQGWLTRYPSDVCSVPSEWMQEFVACGGSCDSAGIWGASPTGFAYCGHYNNLTNFPAKQVAGWFVDATRWDNIPDANFVVSMGINIAPDCNLHNLRQLHNAATLINACIDWGFNPLDTMSVWAVVRLAQKLRGTYEFFSLDETKLMKFVATNGTKIAESMGRHWVQGLENYDFLPDTWIGRKLKSDFQKCNHRYDIARKQYPGNRRPAASVWYRYDKHAPTLTKAATTWKVRHGYGDYINTSIGCVYYATAQNSAFEILSFGARRCDIDRVETTQPRQVGDYKVAKLGGVCYVWLATETFNKHVEAPTVREAIAKAEKRFALKGLKISFAMVREAKQYCLPGTKSWMARNGFNFFVALLADYHQTDWSDVPQEIMDITWEFASREYFHGKLD